MEGLTVSELTIFLTAIGSMLILAKILVKLGRRFGLSPLMIEIFAGVILGPTLLGNLFPHVYHLFFPNQGHLPDAYDTLINLSVIMLLFWVGLDLDVALLAQQTKNIIMTGAMAILLPFIGGCLLAWQFFDFLHGIDISAAPHYFVFLVGTLLTISAPAIAARILLQREMFNTKVGVVIIGVAMLSELICWLLFSSIMIYVNAEESNIQILYTLLYILGFFVIVFFIASQKKIISTIFAENNTQDLSLLFGICLLTAAFTNSIHIHPTFGALIAGIVCRRIVGEHKELIHQLETFIMNFFSPIFFISLGLRVNFVENFNLGIILVLFLVAYTTKMGGGYIGARLSGFSHKESMATGFGLNSRGSVEIIMGAVALKTQLIGLQLFVAIIVVAIISNLVTEYGLYKTRLQS